jgi:diguanylate cyclase (GGDEF)-like protein
MTSLFTFLISQHDIRLVLLSLGVAAAAAFVTFTLYAHLLVRSSGRNGGWLLLTTISAGSGIWAAHIIMALSITVEGRIYNAWLGLLSLAVTFAAVAVGIAIASRPRHALPLTGGAVIGLGAAIGHFIGLAAFTFAGGVEWSVMPGLLAAVLGVVLCAAATQVFQDYHGKGAVIPATVLMGAGISATLLIGMSAITVTPELRALVSPAMWLNAAAHGLAAAAIAALILATAYIAAVLEGKATRTIFSRLDELIDTAFEGLVIAEDGKIVSVNARLLEMTGRRQGDLVGRLVFDDLLGMQRREAPPGATLEFEASLLNLADRAFPVQVIRRPLHALARNSEVFAIRDLRDQFQAADRIANLTAEMKSCQQAVRQRNFLLDGVLCNMSQGLCMFDAEQRVVLSNERYSTMYGLPADSAQPGTHLHDILQKRVDKGIFAGGSPKSYMEQRLRRSEKSGETLEELNDGRMIRVSRTLMPTGGWIITHEDVTEKRHMEEQNKHLALYDTLTDLPNRDLLRKMMEETMASAVRSGRRLVVMLLDLDHFREVNDTLGHAVGDALLKEVAVRLRSHTRKSTILGRFGDDEFLVVEAVDQPSRDAASLAGRIQEQLRMPFRIEGKDVFIDSTIGIAVSGDATSAAGILKSADVALYRAKKEARGTYRFYEGSMDRQLRERLSLEQDLAEALAREQFELHYQPLVSLTRNEITGFEALLRWQRPGVGLVPPAKFLEVAENAGLMPSIEEWTLRHACHEAVRWPEPLKVALNISPARFKSKDFVRSVVSALASSGLNAQRLEIEISERVIQSDPENAETTLRQLSDLGVQVALDDFGTGFASLNYLREMPIRRVKIDRQFMSNLSEQGHSHIILRTLAKLGAGFGVATTAEGVETQEQFDIVRAEGCTEMQGYFFSPPKTAGEIRRLFLPKEDAAVA